MKNFLLQLNESMKQRMIDFLMSLLIDYTHSFVIYIYKDDSCVDEKINCNRATVEILVDCG